MVRSGFKGHSQATVRLWQALTEHDYATAGKCLEAGADVTLPLGLDAAVSDSDDDPDPEDDTEARDKHDDKREPITMAGELEGSREEVPQSWTAIHLAARTVVDEAGAAFLAQCFDAGADCNLPEQGADLTPLHLAGSPLATLALLEAGADVHLTDAAGRTPLHVAQSPAIAIQLLANDADPSAEDRRGETAATHKASQRNLERFGFKGNDSAMMKLNDIGTSFLISDWIQSAHLLPAVQSLAWAKVRHTRLGKRCSPAASLLTPLWRRIGLEVAKAEVHQGALSMWIWSRFKVWLEMRTEIQRAKEARQTAALLKRLWDEAGGGVHGGVSAVQEAVADELSECKGLLDLLAGRNEETDDEESDDDESDEEVGWVVAKSPSKGEAEPEPEPEPELQFAAGDLVEVAGLQAAPQHNGKRGEVLRFDVVKGRFVLKIPGMKKLAVKPANVRERPARMLEQRSQAQAGYDADFAAQAQADRLSRLRQGTGPPETARETSGGGRYR